MSQRGSDISTYFGELTFGLSQMRARLSMGAYKDLVRSLETKKKISKSTGDSLAQVIKEWALSRGASHFCHWFQPMNGLTAEKHDAFISLQLTEHGQTQVIERFSGAQLIQGEPDASSFPSGGMRSTFEARGYTAWDHTSPLFILENGNSKTLCIPSFFIGYHGQALDNKTPLIRSVGELSNAACKFLKLLGDVDVKSVVPTLGVEQEYFLIDSKLARKRPDLMLAERTLMGSDPCRGQKLSDHYFGSIPARIMQYMDEVEQELYRMGIPVKTRHNEVAPSQFEMAPIHVPANVAADHNSLSMEIMKKTALKHGLVCLLHEKPFDGVNGSGKHCNWSIANDKQENLLNPGKTPHQNLRFLAVVACILRALDKRSAVLSAMAHSHGNDLRLGNAEAPPALLSVFLGQPLEALFDNIAKMDAAKGSDVSLSAKNLNVGVDHLTELALDYADRNRTSPFAFTGNKFEFRTVGSSANVALPIAALNAAVAESFEEGASQLTEYLKTSGGRDKAIIHFIHTVFQNHKRVLFSGNNYSAEWQATALDRGLRSVPNDLEAVRILSDAQETEFLTECRVLSNEELQSRASIKLDRYAKVQEVELRVMLQLVRQHALPALEKQMMQSSRVHDKLMSRRAQENGRKRCELLESLYSGLTQLLEDADTVADNIPAPEAFNLASVADFCQRSSHVLEKLRAKANAVEEVVAAEFWTLPTYRELLFSHKLG